MLYMNAELRKKLLQGVDDEPWTEEHRGFIAYMIADEVDGQPIDRYCADRRFSVEARLRRSATP